MTELPKEVQGQLKGIVDSSTDALDFWDKVRSTGLVQDSGPVPPPWVDKMWAGVSMPYTGGEYFKEKFTLNPFSDLVDVYKVRNAAQRVEEGEADENDNRLLREFLIDQQRQSVSDTKGYWFGKIGAEMPAFILDYAGTLKIAKLLTGASKGAVRAGLGKMVKDSAEKAVVRSAEAAVKRKVLGRVGRQLERAAIESAIQVPLSPTLYARALEKTIPQLGVHPEAGLVMMGSVGSFLDALPEATLDTYIEFMSEKMGGVPPISYIAAGQAAVLNKWLKLNPKATMPEALEKIARATGWNSMIGEVGEEILGEAARAAVGLVEWEDVIPGGNQMLGMMAAFALPGAASVALQKGAQVAASPVVPFDETAEARAAEGPGPTFEQTFQAERESTEMPFQAGTEEAAGYRQASEAETPEAYDEMISMYDKADTTQAKQRKAGAERYTQDMQEARARARETYERRGKSLPKEEAQQKYEPQMKAFRERLKQAAQGERPELPETEAAEIDSIDFVEPKDAKQRNLQRLGRNKVPTYFVSTPSGKPLPKAAGAYSPDVVFLDANAPAGVNLRAKLAHEVTHGIGRNVRDELVKIRRTIEASPYLKRMFDLSRESYAKDMKGLDLPDSKLDEEALAQMSEMVEQIAFISEKDPTFFPRLIEAADKEGSTLPRRIMRAVRDFLNTVTGGSIVGASSTRTLKQFGDLEDVQLGQEFGRAFRELAGTLETRKRPREGGARPKGPQFSRAESSAETEEIRRRAGARAKQRDKRSKAAIDDIVLFSLQQGQFEWMGARIQALYESTIKKAISARKQKKFSPKQLIAELKAKPGKKGQKGLPGASKAELQWYGFDSFLKSFGPKEDADLPMKDWLKKNDQKVQITKQDVLAWINVDEYQTLEHEVAEWNREHPDNPRHVPFRPANTIQLAETFYSREATRVKQREPTAEEEAVLEEARIRTEHAQFRLNAANERYSEARRQDREFFTGAGEEAIERQNRLVNELFDIAETARADYRQAREDYERAITLVDESREPVLAKGTRGPSKWGGSYSLPNALAPEKRYSELLVRWKNSPKPFGRTIHFQDSNFFVWIRSSYRAARAKPSGWDATELGEVFLAEEIQSDWVSQGREQGFFPNVEGALPVEYRETAVLSETGSSGLVGDTWGPGVKRVLSAYSIGGIPLKTTDNPNGSISLYDNPPRIDWFEAMGSTASTRSPERKYRIRNVGPFLDSTEHVSTLEEAKKIANNAIESSMLGREVEQLVGGERYYDFHEPPMGGTAPVPALPWEKSWMEFGLKRAIRLAVDRGDKHFAITGGEIQVQRNRAYMTPTRPRIEDITERDKKGNGPFITFTYSNTRGTRKEARIPVNKIGDFFATYGVVRKNDQVSAEGEGRTTPREQLGKDTQLMVDTVLKAVSGLTYRQWTVDELKERSIDAYNIMGLSSEDIRRGDIWNLTWGDGSPVRSSTGQLMENLFFNSEESARNLLEGLTDSASPHALGYSQRFGVPLERKVRLDPSGYGSETDLIEVVLNPDGVPGFQLPPFMSPFHMDLYDRSLRGLMEKEAKAYGSTVERLYLPNYDSYDGTSDYVWVMEITPEMREGYAEPLPVLLSVGDAARPRGNDLFAAYVSARQRAAIRAATTEDFAKLFMSLPPDREFQYHIQSIRETFGDAEAVRFAQFYAAAPNVPLFMLVKFWTDFVEIADPSRLWRPEEPRNVLSDLVDRYFPNSPNREAMIRILSTQDPVLSTENAGVEIPEDTLPIEFADEAKATIAESLQAAVAVADRYVFDGALGAPERRADEATFRRAAEIASEASGEQYTPQEIQQAVWSWADTAVSIVDTKAVADRAIEREVGLNDIDNLRAILEEAGYADIIRALERAYAERQPQEASAAPRTAAPQVAVEATTRTPEVEATRLAVGRQVNTPPGTIQDLAGGLTPRGTNFVTRFVDSLLRGRQYTEAVENLTDENDIYMAGENFYGRVGEQLKQTESRVIKPLRDKLARTPGASIRDFSEYLYARHAPRRNEVIAQRDPEFSGPGSGMETVEAQQIVARAETSPKGPVYRELAETMYDLLEEKQRIAVQTGLKSQAQVDAERRIFGREYVPLKTDFGEEYVRGMGTGLQPSAGPIDKRAKGRKSRAFDALSYSLSDYTRTLIQGEKNRVMQALRQLILDNPDPDVWQVAKGKPTVQFPDGVFRTDPNAPFDNDLAAKLYAQAVNEVTGQEHLLRVKIDGQEYIIWVKDGRLGRAFKRLGASYVPQALNWVRSINQWIRMTATSWNPAFVFRNFFRDVATAGLNITSDEGAEMAAAVIARVPKAVRAGWKALFYPDATGADVEQFREMMREGGATGWFRQMTAAQWQTELEDAVADFSGGVGSMKRGAYAFKDFMENLSGGVEMGVRFAYYQELRARGASPARAAHGAKTVTVNFNRKGEWGTVIDTFYMFFNASMQGSVLVAKAAKRKPALAAGIIATGFMVDFLAAMASGSDDDDVLYYDKLPQWKKETAALLPLFYGKGDAFFAVPLPYGFNFLHEIGRNTAAVMRGGQSKAEAAHNLAVAGIGAFSPIGSEATAFQVMSPTFFDPFAQVIENKTFFGSTIYPEPSRFEPDIPDSYKWWGKYSPDPTFKQKLFSALARGLNEATGGDAVEGGLIDISPETMEHFFDFVIGGTGRFMSDLSQTATGQFTTHDDLLRKAPIIRSFTALPDPYYDREKYRKITNTLKRASDVVDDDPTLRPVWADLLKFETRMKVIDKQVRAMKNAGTEGWEEKRDQLYRAFNAAVENAKHK